MMLKCFKFNGYSGQLWIHSVEIIALFNLVQDRSTNTLQNLTDVDIKAIKLKLGLNTL